MPATANAGDAWNWRPLYAPPILSRAPRGTSPPARVIDRRRPSRPFRAQPRPTHRENPPRACRSGLLMAILAAPFILPLTALFVHAMGNRPEHDGRTLNDFD